MEAGQRSTAAQHPRGIVANLQAVLGAERRALTHTSTHTRLMEAANLSVLGERRTIVLLYVPLLTMFTTLGMTLVDYDTHHVARSERTYLVSCAVNSDTWTETVLSLKIASLRAPGCLYVTECLGCPYG